MSLPGGKRGADQCRLLSRFCYPIVGLAEHLGVVDCTPPMSELVWLGFNDALVSEPLNIHRSHAIIVRPVATVRALVFVRFPAPVCFADQAACRTGLARVARVNRNDGVPGFCGFVFDHLS